MQESKIPDLNDVSKAAESMAEQLRQGLSGNLQPLLNLLDQVLTHHEALAQAYLGLLGEARQALHCFKSPGPAAVPPVRKMTVQ